MMKFWTDERCARAIDTLHRSRTLEEACAALSSEFEAPVTRCSIETAMIRHANTTFQAHLAADFTAEQAAGIRAEPATERRIPVFQDDEPTIEKPPPATSSDVEEPEERELTEAERNDADIAARRARVRAAGFEAANKRLLQELDDVREQLEVLKDLRATTPLRPIEERRVVGATQRQGTPVMLCSDWHVEEPVDPRTVNGLNEYNLDIADRCIARMADAFEWLLRDPRYDCRQGIVWLGGDLYSGFIHEDLAESNELSPVEAVKWLLERTENMLRRIAATTSLERIIVPCNNGNHGRLTHKMRVQTRAANSLEWLLYHTLAGRLADDPRFEFHIADGEWSYIDVFDKTLAFTHGDSFRYQGGVGGISIPLRRGINEVRKYRKVDYVSLGHFHQRCDFGDIIVNGSMIGVSPYSMRIHAPPEPRQQTWYMIDARRGKTLSAPVTL